MNGPAMRSSMPPNIQQQPFTQPMGMLSTQQPRPPQFQQPSQQRNSLLIGRPPQGAPPPNSLQGSASVAAFPTSMMNGPQPVPQGPGGIRRVPSQPHMSMLGGMPPNVGMGAVGGLPMSMGAMGSQTSLPLRQGQPQVTQQQALQQQQQQQQHQHQQQQQQAQIQHAAQFRLQAAHQQNALQQNALQQQMIPHSAMGTPDMNMMRGQSSGGLGVGGGIARTPSAQNQVMSSLSQPPTPSGMHTSSNPIGGMGMSMPPPHHGVGSVPSVSPRQRTGAPSPRPGAMPSTHAHPHPHGNPYPHPNAHLNNMGLAGVFTPPINPSPGHNMMSMPPPSASTNPLGMPTSSANGPMGMPPQNNGMLPAHHPQRTPRMTPDNTAAAVMGLGMYSTSRPGGMGGSPGGPGGIGGGISAAGMYGSGSFVNASTPPMGMVGVTGNEGIAQGGTPTQTSFQTPAQQYALMNAGANHNVPGGPIPSLPSSNSMNATNGGGNPNTGNNDIYASFGNSMAPPSSIPPQRPPSHPTNTNPGPQTPQQVHTQVLAHQHQLNLNVQHQHAINQQHQHQQQQQQQQQHAQQHGQHMQPHHPQHPSHAHGQPPHLGTPHSAQQQHSQQQQQQQQHGSPPGPDRDVQMHPQRPQSQPQRPPSQASRTPRSGPTPIPSTAPGGPQQHPQQQQHPGGALPPPGVSASSSSNSSSSVSGAAGPAPNGIAMNPGPNQFSSGGGPSALGNTPLTQTGMRSVPMQGGGAFASMGGMGMGGMTVSNGMNGSSGGLMNIGPHTLPPQPPNGNVLGGMSNSSARPGGPGPGAPAGAPGGAGGGVPVAPGQGAAMGGGAAPPDHVGGGGGGGTPPGGPSAPPLQRSQISTTPTVNVGSGQGVIRLLQFSGVLSTEMKSQKLQLHWWSDLVKEYFTPQSVMKLTLWRDSLRNEAKPFEIGVPILPRFFLVTTQSGVKSMSFSIDGARERSFGQGHSVVECVSAVWTYRYMNGYTVTLRGPLTVHVIIVASGPGSSTQMLKFEDFQFDANTHDKYVASDAILGMRSIECTEKRIDGMHEAAAAAAASGSMDRGAASAQAQQEEEVKWEEPRVLITKAVLPGEPVNAFGIPQATMRCLELAESVSLMGNLITFAYNHEMGPLDSLRVVANGLRDSGYAMPPVPSTITVPPPAPPPSAPQSNPPNPNPNSNTAIPPSFTPYSQPGGPTPSGTLYSSAPPSVTNPLPSSGPPQQGSSSTMTSPGTTSSSANSPEKQLKTIPQQDGSQQQPGSSHAQASGSGSGQQGQPPASASSPAISSGGTTNTPALSNTSLKRKQASDATSPTVGNPDQPAKRGSRKRPRGGTNG